MREYRDELADLEGIRDTPLAEAACVTMVESDDLPAVSRGFGGLVDKARELTLDQVSGTGMMMAVRRVGDWVLVVEVNGFQGARPEVLKRVSVDGRAVSAYWNVGFNTHFYYAVAGEVRTEFEPVSPDYRFGTDPDGLEDLRAPLAWDDEDPVSLMLMLAGRVTGAPFQAAWLEEKFLVMPVQPVADELRSKLDPDLASLTYDEGTLAWALRHADERTLRRAAQAAVDYVIDATGIGAFPEVAAFVPARLRSSGPLDKLQSRLDRQSDRHPGDRRLSAQFVAVRALRQAANPDPLAAGFEVVATAFLSLRVAKRDARELRAVVSAVLGDPEPPSGSLGLTAGTGPEPTDRFEWITRHWLRPGGALTLVRGATVPEVAQALNGELSRATDGIPVLSAAPMIFIRQVGDWVVAIRSESTGIPALEVQWRRLPSGAASVDVSWHGKSTSTLYYVTGGQLCAQLNPYNLRDRAGSDPAFLRRHLTGLPLPLRFHSTPATLPPLLVVTERLTGLALTPEWLDQPHLMLPRRPFVMS